MVLVMTTTTPAYAKAKTITSISGLNATHKHVATLRRAQVLLRAQGTTLADAAATAIQDTIDSYAFAARTFYRSEHYPYRRSDAV